MYCSGRNTILRLTEYILHKSEIYVHANKNSQTDLIELPWRVQKQLFNQFWSLLKYFYSTCISCRIWAYLENTFQKFLVHFFSVTMVFETLLMMYFSVSFHEHLLLLNVACMCTTV